MTSARAWGRKQSREKDWPDREPTELEKEATRLEEIRREHIRLTRTADGMAELMQENPEEIARALAELICASTRISAVDRSPTIVSANLAACNLVREINKAADDLAVSNCRDEDI